MSLICIESFAQSNSERKKSERYERIEWKTTEIRENAEALDFHLEIYKYWHVYFWLKALVWYAIWKTN